MSIILVMGIAWLIIRIVASIWGSYNGNKAPKQWLTYEQIKENEMAFKRGEPQPYIVGEIYEARFSKDHQPYLISQVDEPDETPVPRNTPSDTLELPVVEPDIWANTVPESMKITTEIPIIE